MKKRMLIVLAALALLLSACSDGDPKAESGGTDGGGDEVATGEPIHFAVQAPTEGATAYPQTGFGAEAAEWYVNNVLGGVNGRPIDVKICAGDGSPETAINCANKHVSNDAAFVLDAYDQGINGALPILKSAGIPIIGTLAGSPNADQGEYGDVFYFTGPTAVSALGSLSILDQLGKKNVTLAVNEAPTSHTYVDTLIRPIAEAFGMTFSVQYPPTTGANFSVVAATQISEKPDAAGVIALPEDGCTALVSALRQQGYDGTIFAGSCSQFIDEVGEDAAGSVVQPRLWVPLAKSHAPDRIAKELDEFERAMNEVGYGDELSARSLYSFAGVVNVVRVLETIDGEITKDSVRDAMKAVKDMETFAGANVTCDGEQWPGYPTACTHQGIFFEVQTDGTLAPIGDSPNGYIDLDPSKIPSA